MKDFAAAVQLLNANQVDKGIEKLKALIAAFPTDAATEKAKGLLLDYGVGEEARVVLDDRKVFRGSFKMLDKDVLAMVEAALEELKPYYSGVQPFFKKRELRVIFYDSEPRYRKAGGMVTAAGHFSMEKPDYRARTLEGKIEWYLPKHAATLKDRQLSMKGLLLHETAHYRNAVAFGGALPGVFEEGIATYLQSRHNTEYYQYYRTTDREEIQGNARNALSSVIKLEDFVAFLQGDRGFGQGGEMIHRWYGLCYAITDFFQEGQLNGKKSSFDVLLGKVESLTAEVVAKMKPGDRPQRLNSKDMLEKIVADVYEQKLEDFHKALIQHVMTKYRQR